MKKMFMAAAALMLQLPVFAQGIEVVSNTPLPIPSKDAVYSPVISPTGEYLLVTSNAMNGLQKYDLATGNLTTISNDNGAGYNVKISNDGSTIVYRNTEFKNRLRYVSVKSVNLATGKTATLVDKSRNVSAFGAVEGTAVAIDNNKVTTKRLVGNKVKTPAIAGIVDGDLVITVNGKSNVINPVGKTRYLWASVSPDGTKVLFAVPKAGATAYVCDLKGNNLTELGRLSAPKWMGNNWVVGMVDKDNGEVVTASTIVAVRANGADYTTLTDGSQICMYPSASSDATKIVYNTGDGRIFLMNVKTK